ncbi:MAG: hydrogenase maturation protease [Firmicutes bacterium]|nr:hydrogenase maturation protease [Bacillota bacterium]
MYDLKYEILVLGLGNTLMSDDGLAAHVVKGLKQKRWPSEILILEIGTSAIFYLEEIGRSRRIIAVDAVRAGGPPGSVYRLTGDDVVLDGRRDSHGFSLLDVIGLAREMTGFPLDLTIYGVEPLDLSLGNHLSAPVKKALPEVINEIAKKMKILINNVDTGHRWDVHY